MEGETKGSQLNKACLSRALKATVREREGGDEGAREKKVRGLVINFHFLCLIIPSSNEICRGR